MGNCPERGEAAHEGENIILTAGGAGRDRRSNRPAAPSSGRQDTQERPAPPYRQIYFSVSGEKDSCKEEKDAL